MRSISKKHWWVIIILALVILASFILIWMKKNENNKQLARDYANKLVINPAKNYNAEIIEGIKSRVGQVPFNYLKVLYDKQIYMRTVNGPIECMSELTMSESLKENKSLYLDYAGVFVGSSMSIRIDQKYFPGIELHELGHAVDYILFNNISNSSDYKKIFEKEGTKLFNKPGNEYYIQNLQEYFAESFNFYYYGYITRKDLKEKAPETYKFIKNLESKNSND